MNLLNAIFKPNKKKYVSEIDEFLAEFDKRNPKKSNSQIEEIGFYKRISHLRDHGSAKKSPNIESIWSEF